jgi:hypothetical protein
MMVRAFYLEEPLASIIIITILFPVKIDFRYSSGASSLFLRQ